MVEYLKNLNFNVTDCDIYDIITESIRYSFHISLIYLATYLINGDKTLIGYKLFETLLTLIISIIIYNILFKKMFYPLVNKLKSQCEIDKVKKLLDKIGYKNSDEQK